MDLKGENMESHVTGIEDVNVKREIQQDNQMESKMSVRDVFTNHPALVFWVVVWALAGCGWGFDAQVNGGMIGVPYFRRDFGDEFINDKGVRDWELPPDWLAAFNTISSVGQFFGGFLCSVISDRIGRKGGLFVGLLFATGGVFGEVFSQTRPAFLISKLILGVGLGFYLTLSPLVTSEISPVVFRGIATATVQFGLSCGQLLSNAAIKGFGERDDSWAYKGPFAIQLFFSVFLFVMIPFAPESPWYLARVGKRDAAKNSLRRLYGSQVDLDAKLAKLEATIAEEEAIRSKQGSWVQCFKGTNLIRTVISMGVFCCQHFVGIIFVLGFSSYFFQLAGLPLGDSFNMGIGVTACGLLGNIVSWFTVNRLGRRLLFVTGIFALTAILFIIGILDVVPTSGAKWVQASLTVFYGFVYACSLGPMAFVLLGETSSTTLRAPTVALATATQAVMGTAFNFAIPYMVSPTAAHLNGKVGFVFGGLGLIASIWAWFFIPELRGRSFQEIDTMFQNKVPPRQMGSYQITSY